MRNIDVSDIGGETEKSLQLASKGSTSDTIALTFLAPKIPDKYHLQVLSHFLKTLRDLDSGFQLDKALQSSHAQLAIRILNGIGRCFEYVVQDKAVADALLEDWDVVARCTRRFCDNFKSVQEPCPGSLITYEDWYCGLLLTLLITTADEAYAHKMWTFSDARYAMCRLWVLGTPPMLLQFAPICTGILRMFIIRSEQYGSDLPTELVNHAGVSEEAVAHLVMARFIDATKNEAEHEMRDHDHAYIVLSLLASSNESIRSILLKKKAIPFLTKTFLACALDSPKTKASSRDFVDNFLIRFEFITEKDCTYPYLLQALRHGFLKGVVKCGASLDTFNERTVDALKHILEDIMIMYLVYYPFVIGVLDAIKEINHKDIERFIDQGELKLSWARFEEYLLAHCVVKSYFEQSIQSDLSIITCAQCTKKDYKDNINFQKCGGCQNVHYCSKDCQTNHWKHGGHRLTCKNMPDEMRGWSRRDHKYRDFLAMMDIGRHTKGFHQLAVKKYGLDPIPPRGDSLPYGYSLNYTTVPPTMEVFRLEDEPRAHDPSYKAENERVKQMVEATGNLMCLRRIRIPEGRTVTTHIGQGTLGVKDHEIWEEDFDASQKARGLHLRAPGVDEDGVPLQVISDQIDITINDLSTKVRVGSHFLWNRCACCGDGQVVVTEEIDRLAKSLLGIFGDLLLNPNAGRKTKGAKRT